MSEGLSTLVYLFIGYICGVIFAPDVFSANITATNWYNIWVYAWIFGWPFMLIWHFVTLLLFTPAAIVVTPPPAS